MISTSKVAALIATIGFSRAVLVCGLCLLVTHVVTFEQLVILVLFGFTMDRVSVQKTNTKLKTKTRSHR